MSAADSPAQPAADDSAGYTPGAGGDFGVRLRCARGLALSERHPRCCTDACTSCRLLCLSLSPGAPLQRLSPAPRRCEGACRGPWHGQKRGRRCFWRGGRRWGRGRGLGPAAVSLERDAEAGQGCRGQRRDQGYEAAGQQNQGQPDGHSAAAGGDSRGGGGCHHVHPRVARQVQPAPRFPARDGGGKHQSRARPAAGWRCLYPMRFNY